MTSSSDHRDRARGTRALATALTGLLLLGVAGCSGAANGAEASPAASASAQPTKPSKSDAPALDGTAFTDPGGRYTLTVPADWQASDGVAGEGIEVWLLGDAGGAVATNINVLTEDVTGMSLQDYLDLSIANAGKLVDDFELISSDVVTGSAGQELAVMEYTGVGLHFLGVFGMSAQGSVVITLTASPDDFAAYRDAALPYMLTLVPTDA